MALTRGTKSNFPCPVCLVPKEEMHRGVIGSLHTTETMREIYNEAMEMSTAEQCEALLKSFSLCGIEVCEMLAWLSAYLHNALLIG